MQQQLREEQLQAVRNRVQELFAEPALASDEEREPAQPSEVDREPGQPADAAPEQGEEGALEAARAAASDRGAAAEGIPTPTGDVFSDADEDPGQEQTQLAGPVVGVGSGGGALVVEGFAEKFQRLLAAAGRHENARRAQRSCSSPAWGRWRGTVCWPCGRARLQGPTSGRLSGTTRRTGKAPSEFCQAEVWSA